MLFDTTTLDICLNSFKPFITRDDKTYFIKAQVRKTLDLMHFYNALNGRVAYLLSL
jgi:hypothetical protein